MANYSASDIIGKAMRAKVNVIAYKGYPSSPYNYTIKAGNPVGTVYSYIYNGKDANTLWWEFHDVNGKPYYVKHALNSFDIETLISQGLESTEEKKKEAAEEKKKKEMGDFAYYMEKWGKYIVGLGVGAYVIVNGIKYYANSRSNNSK